MSIKTIRQPQITNVAPLTRGIKRLAFTTIFLALAFLAVLTLTQPFTQTASLSPSFSLSTSGAVTSYLNDADVNCQANTLSLNVPATGALNGYTLNFTSPVTMPTAKPTLIDSNNTLEFHLSNAQQLPYRTFSATSGEVFLSNNQAVISAFLVDENSQSIFLNASFSCS